MSNPTVIPESSGNQSPYVLRNGNVPVLPRQAAAAAWPEDRQFDLNSILQTIRRWRWLIVGMLFAACAIAVAISLLTTPLYRATTVLEINEEPVQIIEVGQVQSGGMNDSRYFDTQLGLLQSTSLVERVQRQLGLAGNSRFVGDAPVSARDQLATQKLAADYLVVSSRNSRLVNLHYVSPDPAFAARVTNNFADSFIEGNLERRFASTSYARTFLEKRLATVKARLEKTERQLVAYAQQQNIVGVPTGGPEGGETSLSATSLSLLNASLAQAQSDRIAAQQRYRQAATSGSTTDSLNNPTIQALQTQRAQLNADFQDKLGTYKPEHPTLLRLSERIAAIDSSIASASRSVSNAVGADYRAALGRERALQGRVRELTSNVLDVRRRSIQYNILQREVDTNRTLYDGLLQRYKEIGVAGGVGTNLVSVVDRARPPSAPFSPNLWFNIAIAIGIGLAAGLGLAFVLEYIADTINSPDDLSNKLHISALGAVPVITKGLGFEDLLRDQRSDLSEAYASARTAIQFSSPQGPPRTLLVTSSQPSEGKTSSAVAIARSFAALGFRALLIDGDFRSPSLRGADEGRPGFAHLLTHSAEIDECIEQISSSNLYLLASGMVPPNPSDLLGSARAVEVLNELNARFDIVVIDGPPVLGLADAPLLSSICEGTILVIEAGTVRRRAARMALGRLRAANAYIVGGLLTKYSPRSGSYGYGNGYGYGYGYGNDQEASTTINVDLLTAEPNA